MLAFIYTKNKVIRDDEIEEDDIYENHEDKHFRITKPPDWLGINQKRVNMDESDTVNVDPKFWGDFHDDESVIDFEKMRKEFTAQADSLWEQNVKAQKKRSAH